MDRAKKMSRAHTEDGGGRGWEGRGGERQGRADEAPGCEDLLHLLRGECEGKVRFLKPLAGGGR